MVVTRKTDEFLDSQGHGGQATSSTTAAAPYNVANHDSVAVAGTSSIHGGHHPATVYFQSKLGLRKDAFRTNEEEHSALGEALLDEDMRKLRDMVDSCKVHDQFLTVLQWIMDQKKEFVTGALFHVQGRYCITTIIWELRRSDVHPCVFQLTEHLKSWFVQLMISPSSILIYDCFGLLEDGPNQVLYKQLLDHACDLAKHAYGYESINKCIDIIVEGERMKLLEHIAIHSLELSPDRYGNLVVQHVIVQRCGYVNWLIVDTLKGHFVSLLESKAGSDVVCKCLEWCSSSGITVVVEEILGTGPETLSRLAQHHVTYYVFQKALRKTAEYREINHLHDRLVNALKPTAFRWPRRS